MQLRIIKMISKLIQNTLLLAPPGKLEAETPGWIVRGMQFFLGCS